MAPNRFGSVIDAGWRLGMNIKLFSIPFPDLKIRFEMLEEIFNLHKKPSQVIIKGLRGSTTLKDFWEPSTLSNSMVLVVGRKSPKHLSSAGKYKRNLIFTQDQRNTSKSIHLFKTIASENGRDEKVFRKPSFCAITVVGVALKKV
ncbi:MAG: hypothetical protein CM15mP108_3370 [Gammaproteobacteria bacterium]|nr:MAG: hypothetical protein CM15mP108_3370 [Gammaproteobacteria bacterium]